MRLAQASASKARRRDVQQAQGVLHTLSEAVKCTGNQADLSICALLGHNHHKVSDWGDLCSQTQDLAGAVLARVRALVRG